MPKRAPSVKDYLDKIDVSVITTGLWNPAVQWNRWHGDGKSKTAGAYHIETMLDNNGVYKAKVIGPGGGATVEKSWPQGTVPVPTIEDVIAKLKE